MTKKRVRAAAMRLEEDWFQKMLRYMKTGKAEDGRIAVAESDHFTGVPAESLEGIAVDFHGLTEWEMLKKLGCWNRARRKALLKSNSVIVHLFSGRQEKEALKRLEKDGKGHFVMSIDLLTGMDVRNVTVWALLLKLAASGRVSAVIAGPPCRTFSILRFRPPGPRPVRPREQPYGLDDLDAEERRLVDQDTGLFCRFLFLHSAATAGRVLNEEAELKEVAFFVEQPADPDEYLEADNPLYGKVPTFWQTPLWQRYREEAQLRVVTFDQLPLGHPTVKPTGGGTNMEGVRCLDGIKATERPPTWTGPSSDLATWSTGLCEVIAEGIRSWGGNPRIFKMTEEQWKAHVSRGHVPYRRDCLTCVAGGGIGRRHARVEHPDSFVLTADTSGPLKTPGRDSHQRGAKRAMKYMFVARLRVPKVFLQTAGCPMKASSIDEEVIVEEDGPDPLEEGQPEKEHAAREDPDDDMNLDGLFPSDVEEEGDGVREECEKGEEPSGSREGRKDVKTGDDVPAPLDDLEPPEMVSIVWVSPLADNKSPTVLEALQDVVYHARALNVPILRFHSDRSLEFYAKATRRWIKMNGMRMTASEGGVPQSNGLAERTVKWAKQRARVLLKSAGLAPEFWPFAVQAAAAQQRAEVLGFTTKMAAPFGAKVLVKQKPYDERGTVAKPDNMKSQWLDGKYLGLSDVIPHGHLVYVEGDRPMFIHTLHVRARLRDPGPPVEELEVSLVPRRIRGKQPPEEPAVVISQSQVADFEVEDPVRRACQVIASMATTWGTTPKIRGVYGLPGDVRVYGCDQHGQWITQLLVATMVQAFPDARFGTVDLQDVYDGGTQEVRRETGCGHKVYVLPLVMPLEGRHLWVEVLPGDYVVGEVVQMTDFDGEVHLGVVHRLQEGIPFSYDPGRRHCVTEWRQRRAVLHAYSSGMEKHLGTASSEASW